MARTPHIHLENNFTPLDISIDSKWASVKKHKKFISKWDDNQIILDVSHHQDDLPKLKYIDLDSISLAVYGDKSIYSSNMYMSDFSNLCDITKLSLNAALFRYERGKLTDAIGRQLSLVQKVFVWMTRNGIYKFSELKPSNFSELSVELAKVGWWGVLDYNNAFKFLLNEATVNGNTLDSLLGSGKVNRLSLNYNYIISRIGLPLPSTQIPFFFREGVAKLYGDKRPNPKGADFNLGNSPDSLIDTFSGINLLALHPDFFDCIQFLPYPFASRVAKKLRHNSKPNRTNTISLSDAVCIFKEATKWVYILSSGILSLVGLVREEIDSFAKDNLLSDIQIGDSKSQKLDGILRNIINHNYSLLKHEYNFPYESLNLSFGSNSLKGLLHTLQTSLFILIAINHGRRLNEIIGKDLPYGLYKGCVIENGFELPTYSIEIYIEKTIQDYSQFSCNKVVADCVDILEKIFDLVRPLNSPIKNSSNDINERRKDKLFNVRNLSIAGFLGELVTYSFNDNSSEFFRLASVNQSVVNNRAHPFRRLFALLYMNRFDHPELIALQNHLRHTSLESTNVYVSPGNGELSFNEMNKIDNLAERENAGFNSELNSASSEYLINKVMDILEGRLVGGYFPRLVSKLINRLNSDAEFIKDSVNVKSQKLAKIFTSRGFSPLPMSTGVCMVGNSKHTQKIAKCHENGKLNPSKASPETCSECVNHLYPMTTLKILENEIEELLANSKDTKIPELIRREQLKEAESLKLIKQFEINIAENNKTIFDNFAKSWSEYLDKNI